MLLSILATTQASRDPFRGAAVLAAAPNKKDPRAIKWRGSGVQGLSPWLPFVLYLLRKSYKVVYFQHGAVVEDGGAVEAAEDLVLVAFDDDDAGQ